MVSLASFRDTDWSSRLWGVACSTVPLIERLLKFHGIFRGVRTARRLSSNGPRDNPLYGNARSGTQAVRILSAKTKAKPKGTGIEGKDATEIIAGVQAMYEKIPAFVRPMLPALPDILRRIPASAGKYTLNEIIQLLDEAYETGRLKR
jgi:hypothetical protein